MKILFYADPHFRETSSYPLFNRIQENGLSGELNNTLLGFNFIRDLIKNIEPDLVINLGDSYHKDNFLSVMTLHAASLGMDLISSLCRKLKIDHIILMGNHDLYGILGDGTVLSSLCTLEVHGLTITENQIYNLNKDFRIFLMPYCDNLEQNYQSILEGSRCNLIAAHTDFLGTVHDNGHPVEVGLDPHVAVPVICGHIHLQQQVGSVIYPGSLVQNRFSRESIEGAGGILVYDTEKNEYEIFQNDYSKHFVKVRNLNTLNTLDPDKCILKIFCDAPEEDIKYLLEGFQYMYITTKDKEETNSRYLINEIDKPEKMLRDFISEEKPEYLKIYDKVVK